MSVLLAGLPFFGFAFLALLSPPRGGRSRRN
jgi:hypothetical protein